jgi:hypothetical protein
MGRPRIENPRRERVATYLTAAEKKSVDKICGELFPRLSMSDAIREIILGWVTLHTVTTEEKRLIAEARKRKITPGEDVEVRKERVRPPKSGRPSESEQERRRT